MNETLDLLYSDTSLLTVYILLFFIKSIIFDRRRHLMDAPTLVTFLLLVLFSFVRFLCGYSDHLSTTLKCFVFLFYMAFLLKNKSPIEKQKLYTSSFVWIGYGIIVAGICSILFGRIPTYSSRWAFTDATTINSQGIVCGLTFVNLLYSLVFLKPKNKFNHILGLSFSFLFGFFTQSRSFILCVLLGSFMLLVFLMFTLKMKTFVFIAMVLVIVATLISIISIVSSEFRETVLHFLKRFDSSNDMSNGRYYLWNETISKMKSNWEFSLFGAGSYTTLGVFDENQATIKVAHNFLLETWVVYGALGFALVCALFFFFIKDSVFRQTSFKFKLFSIVPISILSIVIFYSHHFIGRSMSLLFVFSFLPFVFRYKLN